MRRDLRCDTQCEVKIDKFELDSALLVDEDVKMWQKMGRYSGVT